MSAMRIRSVLAVAIAVSSLGSPLSGRQAASPIVHGRYIIRLILHVVGDEQFDIVSNADGTRTLTTAFDYSDRGTRRTTTATLTSSRDERPVALDVKGGAPAAVQVSASGITIQLRGETR